MSARDAASVAGQAAADAAAQASFKATEAAAVASAAAISAASDAAEAAADATLLQEIEATPGGTTWDAWRAQAAIEQVKAEMEGRSFDGQFGSSRTMKEIDRMEKSGKSAVECLSQSGFNATI